MMVTTPMDTITFITIHAFDCGSVANPYQRFSLSVFNRTGNTAWNIVISLVMFSLTKSKQVTGYIRQIIAVCSPHGIYRRSEHA